MSLGRWQGIIIRKVIELIRPRFGNPPQSCNKFKMQVAALCFSKQSHEMIRLLYINLLPNCDWNDHSGIDIWLPPLSVVNREALGRLVGVAIVNVFANKLYTPYQRAKMKRGTCSNC